MVCAFVLLVLVCSAPKKLRWAERDAAAVAETTLVVTAVGSVTTQGKDAGMIVTTRAKAMEATRAKAMEKLRRQHP